MSYLDGNGLSTLWSKIKQYVDAKIVGDIPDNSIAEIKLVTAVKNKLNIYTDLIQYEDVTVTISYTAGTIGTRGTQVNCGTTLKSGYTYLGAYVLSHVNTTAFSVNLIRNASTENVHLMAYRANGNAVTNASVVVRKVWVKTGVT